MLAVDYQCSGVTMLVGAGVVKTPRRGEGVRMSTEESAFRSTGSATAASGAPSDAADASVVWMFTSPTAGAPMAQQGSVVVVPGVGIVGDRYALGTGHWSAPRWPDQQLTLFEVEVAEELGCEPYEARRNIVTRGVRLFGLIGVRFRIGGALLAGVRACDPCSYIERLTGRPGLTKQLTSGRGGLRARIIEGGMIRLGDRIEVVGLDDSGAEPPWESAQRDAGH